MTMGSAKGGGEILPPLAASFVLASTGLSFVLAYASFDISM